jgi:hypothetical protein
MLDGILLNTSQIITLNKTLFISISCTLIIPSGNYTCHSQHRGDLFWFPLKGNSVFDSFYPVLYLPRMALDTDVTYLYHYINVLYGDQINVVVFI